MKKFVKKTLRWVLKKIFVEDAPHHAWAFWKD